LTTKSGALSLPDEIKDVNDLRQHLTDCESEWNSVVDDGITSGVDIFLPAFEPQEESLNIHCWQKLVETLLVP